MFQFFLSGLLLLYYWYFYHFYSQPLPKPATRSPDPPAKWDLFFAVPRNNAFQFFVKNIQMWEHILEEDAYLVHAPSKKIIERDDCYHYHTMVDIPAHGLSLYKYLKENPQYKQVVTFQEDSPYAAQQSGTFFYFTCENRRITKLNACPSGKFFQNQRCVDISVCTGQPDFTQLALHSDPLKYIECKNNREFIKNCPGGKFFYHDHCVNQVDLIYFCTFHDTVVPMKIDDETLFECRHHQPIYTKCPPETRIFDNHFCEPAHCVGHKDHTKLALPFRHHDLFHYSPGYVECLHEKVNQSVECPAVWDFSLTQGDNLTMLPMVFDGQQCSVPSFCHNVFSSDPEVIVPVHEFTKHVLNWPLSESYDRAAGYVCTPTGRKRKMVDPDQRISKQFKLEPACGPNAPPLLPVAGSPNLYYDCAQQQTVTCPPGQFFNGKMCKDEPNNAFRYKNIPIFHFDALNSKSWLTPWDYPHNFAPLAGCHSADYEYLKLYNVCCHKDCVPYAFLSMVPDLSMYLPREQAAKCQLDVSDRHIKKEPVLAGYHYWEQRVLPQPINSVETCTFGQKLKSGHFVWDSTVFATCDPAQPFIFCPSTHTTNLLQEQHDVYACAPPSSHKVRHSDTATSNKPWTSYTTNEYQRILPTVSGKTEFHLNRRDKYRYTLPPDGFDLPENAKFNLWTTKPVDLELRYRVTHPPHVAFQYDPVTHQRETLSSGIGTAFFVRMQKFVEATLSFPTYTPQMHVDSF